MAVTSVQEVFETLMPEKLKAKAEIIQKINSSYKFILQGDGGGTWIVDLTDPAGKITAGEGEAKCNVTMAASDFIDVINGKLNAQMAFMSGKLKVSGDIGLALKLQLLLG